MKKNFFVRTGATLLAACSLVSLGACGGKEGKDPSGEKNPNGGTVSAIIDRKVTAKEENGNLTVDNGNVAFTVEKATGNIKSVVSRAKGAELVGGTGANFSLTIDPTTNDVFKANHSSGSAIVLQSKNFTPEVKGEEDGDNYKVTLTYSLSFTYQKEEVSGITVKNTFTLNRKDTHFTVDYSIENGAESECVIVNFTGAQMSGIRDRDEGAWSLFYPYKEGKLYENIVTRINEGTDVGTKMTAGYPSPMSMQLMILYNGENAFDYSVLDAEGVYKEFNFGKYTGNKDYDAGSEVGYQISMSCTQYPFVKTGEEATLSSYRVGVGSEGNWYEGADRYRQFLIDSGMTRAENAITDDWTGMTALTAVNNTGSLFATYESATAATSYGEWIAQSDFYGINTLCAIGWNEGGFDHYYPDYEFSEMQGGETGFEGMVEGLHNNGDSVICYINAHIADVDSKFASTPSAENANLTKLQAGAVKKLGFEYGVTAADSYEKYMYYEEYGTLSAYAMSPSSKDFQDSILAAVRRLAQKGVDGIWFDQLMEMPAYLDYDASHGAKNPATAYSEGYQKLLGGVCDILEESTGGDYLIACEGVCDAYIKYVDVCGMMWARKLGSTDTTNWKDKVRWAAETTRYTLPAKFLGIEGVGATIGSSNEFARAFLMGEPMLCSNNQSSLENIFSVYNSAKSIYFDGRFMDVRGLRIGHEDVLASVILGTDGSIGLQVYNDSRDLAENVRLIFDFDALGLSGKKIAKIVNLHSGNEVKKTSDNSLAVSVKSFAIGAYKITLE